MPEIATRPVALTADQRQRIDDALAASRSPRTREAYAQQWRTFETWCERHGHAPLPATPETVAAYLVDRAADGCKPTTVALSMSSIAAAHRSVGAESPCDHEGVRQTLAGIRRQAAAPPRQAAGLTLQALAAIRAVSHRCRKGPTGRLESVAAAKRRAAVDMALLMVMRDALLRRTEAAALTWADVTRAEDGSGRLTVRRSKTDQEGDGAVLYLSRLAVQYLDAIRPAEVAPRAPVFGLSARHISRRIAAAAAAAGLDGVWSGHSPRVGMAQDLAASGAELPELMTAGRWASPRMPARYTAHEQAARGAVARYYTRQA